MFLRVSSVAPKAKLISSDAGRVLNFENEMRIRQAFDDNIVEERRRQYGT